MKNRYFQLKIPFATRNYINNTKKGLVIKGYAYYVFDRNINQFIKEYIELSKANFRITDDKMMKPTKYYETSFVKNFRTKYLDVYSNKLNLSSNIQYCELDDNQINDLNKEFKCMDSTVLRMFSLLSGSNPSGAETNNKNSPIKYIEGEYFDCNFINPLKKYRISNSKSNNGTWTCIMNDNLRTYSLTQVLKNNRIIPGFKNQFYNYNAELKYKNNINFIDLGNFNEIDYKNDADDTSKMKQIDEEFKMNDKQELFISAIYNKTLDNYKYMIHNNKKKLKQKLRSFYTSNINSKIRNREIPLHSTIQKVNLSVIENAHIVKFSDLINEEKYKDAINPYNCLRIESNVHTLFDKNEISFTKNGGILLNSNNEVIASNYLDISNMPKETLKFFNKIAKEPFN